MPTPPDRLVAALTDRYTIEREIGAGGIGSAVDRTDWKGYILPLLFFNSLSDVWGEGHGTRHSLLPLIPEDLECARC